ncbi:MAG: phosphoglucosamine mutase [Candidatus Aminicenantia bacterium]
MPKYFGTDGIRARAGEFPLDYSSIYTLGRTLVSYLKKREKEPVVLIGRDTRESGEWMEKALIEGIRSGRGQDFSAGIIPTSAVAYLTVKFNYSAGVVISASHNPFYDNGIKIFSSGGRKISPVIEEEIEKAIVVSKEIPERKENDLEVISQPSFSLEYVKFLKSQFPRTLSGKNIKIVVDCSNGASFAIAPQVFSELGFDIIPINNQPDGKNINLNCGSLHPEFLVQEVVRNKADIGIAYDGDTDRAIWVDEKGKILNGDYTLFILSGFMKEKGQLRTPEIVATTMSNLGLELALEKRGFELIRTPVGDKYVLEEMIKRGSSLGGEQSGHTIFLDIFPTGDGILTSLKMMEALIDQEKSLSELAQGMEEFPQILLNVEVKEKKDLTQFPEIVKLIKYVEQKLNKEGRVNIRYSGTEPKIRIMVEGKKYQDIERYAHQIAEGIKKYL